MSEASGSMLKQATLSARGRGLVASHAIKAGEILLQEPHLLLYLDAAFASLNAVCFHCTRLDPSPKGTGSWTICPVCQTATFCSLDCATSSSSSTHTSFVCKALSLLRLSTLDLDLQTQARYLIAAYNLAVLSPHDFQQLLALEGDGPVDEKANVLHTFLSEVIRHWQVETQRLPSWSLHFVASLLVKDQRNAFGLSTYFSDTHLRQVRAYAIYAQASFFNHDCLPNACRFDYIDRPGVGSTDIIIRALHDIPDGAEICISYFPINWSLTERQKKLRDEYGFICKCERCQVEEGWSDEDIAEQGEEISVERDTSEEGDEDMEATDEEVMDAEEDLQGSFPHAMFFAKYLCPHEGCGGTLAPLPPNQGRAVIMECNVCGQLRSEEEFLREIEEYRVSS
ncbi:hypothetical protein KP509_21G023200 [Ceratopteris richardii]|uniref:SET domain-containing protein n=1 Tax=Ceratopteris richardii TaxID=49495 RepID=A0A8T2SA18_CERRI|nr:hypothetical protein KP509_21G023200 [Ceratopteris richardii]